MSGNDDDGDDDTIGYGRPPKEHQFKKGKSGNPRGRPRKVVAKTAPDDHWGTSLFATGRIAYEPVTVTLNGKQTTIPVIEAVHRRRLNDALKGGNRLLQREVIADADAHERQELKREMERFVELQKAKAYGEALIAQARAKGLPEPVLVPHPDDIVIDEYQMTATIDGPDTHEGLAATNHILAVREHLVIRAAYQRRFPPLLSPFTDAHFEGLHSTAHTMNDILCKRLRWGPSGFWTEMRAYDKKGCRFLEADLERSLEAIRKTWVAEPALEAMRKNKIYAKLITSLLNFKTRARERVLWQSQYGRFVSVLRLAFGDAYVGKVPKRLPMRSYLESEARSKRLSAQDSALIDKLCEAYEASFPDASPRSRHG